MGVGYTRQSAADIVDGSTVYASPLNAEFNQLQSAFDSTTGHAHDGTVGEAPKINLATSISGVLPVSNGGIGGINNLSATTNPANTNDNTQGYVVGSIWVNTTLDSSYIAVDVTTNAAVWQLATLVGGWQPLDATLTALAAYNTDGFLVQTAADTFAGRTLTAPAAGLTITNPAGTAGNPTFALANDLAALEGLASTGIAVRTGTDTWAQRTITGTGSITVTNGNGVSGNPEISFTLGNDLAAIEALSGTGFAVRTATDTWAQRTITGTANELTVANGDGVSGNPTLSLPAAMTFTGKTITGGTFNSPTISSATFSGSATFSDLTATGNFTSRGIDDNATSNVLTIQNSGIAYWNTTSYQYGHALSNNVGLHIFSGGNALNVGSNILLYGGAHASGAGDFVVRDAASNVIWYDKSASNIYLYPTAGTGRYSFTNSAFSPTTIDTATLGTTSLQWSDLYLASGGVINYANGNYTLTHSSGLLTASGNLTVSGTLSAGTLSITNLTATTGSFSSTLSAGGLATFTAGATVSGGNFTSRGITDSATTASTLGVSNLALTLTGSTSQFNINREVATGVLAVSGGTANNGGNIMLYGGSHATDAGNILIRSGGSTAWRYDHNGLQTWYQPAGTARMQMGTGALIPATNDGLQLGNPTYSWADLYLASGGTINMNNGDVTIAHAANSLSFGGASSGYNFDAVINANGGQIKFPSTQIPSSDPNTLDDYEEGTWTPVFESNNSSAGITYTSRYGYYVKIGTTVFVNVGITLSNKGANTTGCRVTGIPFAGEPRADESATLSINILNNTNGGSTGNVSGWSTSWFRSQSDNFSWRQAIYSAGIILTDFLNSSNLNNLIVQFSGTYTTGS